mmetsp:Transcript_39195/g.59792  ORF Transcript_39195/g.59792 Transcript_39195/m.59792 type:complete len:111 (-) Transcript_39195:461-793(-)
MGSLGKHLDDSAPHRQEALTSFERLKSSESNSNVYGVKRDNYKCLASYGQPNERNPPMVAFNTQSLNDSNPIDHSPKKAEKQRRTVVSYALGALSQQKANFEHSNAQRQQ